MRGSLGLVGSAYRSHYPEGKSGRPAFALETMLRVHFMQQWRSLSDPAMEEAFFDVSVYRELRNWSSLPACQMSPLSCAFATGCRSTSWPSKS